MDTWQECLDLGELPKGKFDKTPQEFIAKRLAESPTGTIRLMESVCERENMRKALRRVEKNGGAPGVDGMKTSQLRGYMRRHWEKIKASLLDGTYQPLPVRRKEIEKPDGGVTSGDSHGVGSLYSTSDSAGAAGAMGTHVLRV